MHAERVMSGFLQHGGRDGKTRDVGCDGMGNLLIYQLKHSFIHLDPICGLDASASYD